MSGPPQAAPTSLLIAALGGEGGAVLANWIVEAARALKLPVQSTSIPGVAQRTGATTYYLELWPQPLAGGEQAPVMALAPAPGEVDIVASSELLEAGRCIQLGFVTPDRTFLIASTHRFLTTPEKLAMGDGRVDGDKLLAAIEARSRGRLLVDFAAVAAAADVRLNAVMLGVIAGSGKLPITPEAFEAAIRGEGKAVEGNIKGFRAGLAAAKGAAAGAPAADPGTTAAGLASLSARGRAEFPESLQGLLGHALGRLAAFQDAAYAGQYLDRLAAFRQADADLLAAVAKHLAVRMSYDDIIRVAAAKTRPGRLDFIRAEAGAGADDPVVVSEFLKPGLEEVCDILPAGLARWLLARAEKSPRLRGWQKAMELNTTTIWGYLRLRFLARLKPWRRKSYRFRIEQAAIDAWLADIAGAAAVDSGLARAVADCARLIKGYGGSHRRGQENFLAIRDILVSPALENRDNGARAALAVDRARDAALADPDGAALRKLLNEYA